MINKKMIYVPIALFCMFCITHAQLATPQSKYDDTTATTTPGSYFAEDPFAKNTVPADQSKEKNAELEGVQVSAEPSADKKDTTISVYFIFRNRPSGYYYSTDLRGKKIVFEFTDAVSGSAPIESFEFLPMKGFRVETRKVNINEKIAGLNPEWHDLMKITLYFQEVPIITQHDEYSVVSFSFKWSNDPEKQKTLILKEKNKPLIYSIVGGGIVGLGALGLGLFFGGEEPTAESEVSLDGLPDHGVPR